MKNNLLLRCLMYALNSLNECCWVGENGTRPSLMPLIALEAILQCHPILLPAHPLESSGIPTPLDLSSSLRQGV